MSPDSLEPPPRRQGSSPDAGEDTWSVRPYTLTGGRTRPSKDALPIEALVRAAGPPNGGLAGERRQIVELTGEHYVSIAELSAHLHLPVGVTRVLVGDLRDEHLVTIHGLASPDPALNPATTLRVLESVLDGISSL